MSHIEIVPSIGASLARDRFRDDSTGASQVDTRARHEDSQPAPTEDEMRGYAILAKPYAHDARTGRALTLAMVAGRVARSVASQYKGLDAHEIESRTLARVARGVVAAPLSDDPQVRVRQVAGRARKAATRVARKLKTGRGAMPIVFEGERQEGTPNYSLWVGLDEDGKPVAQGKAGKGASWLANRYRLPGETSLVDDGRAVLADRDYAALCAVLANCQTGSRARSVKVDWLAAWDTWRAVTGDSASLRTFRRIAQGAVREAHRAQGAGFDTGRGAPLPAPAIPRQVPAPTGKGWTAPAPAHKGKRASSAGLAPWQRSLAERQRIEDSDQGAHIEDSSARWRAVLAACDARAQGARIEDAPLPASARDARAAVASSSDSWAKD